MVLAATLEKPAETEARLSLYIYAYIIYWYSNIIQLFRVHDREFSNLKFPPVTFQGFCIRSGKTAILHEGGGLSDDINSLRQMSMGLVESSKPAPAKEKGLTKQKSFTRRMSSFSMKLASGPKEAIKEELSDSEKEAEETVSELTSPDASSGSPKKPLKKLRRKSSVAKLLGKMSPFGKKG